MESVSALIERLSLCCAEQSSVTCTTESHFCQRVYRRTDRRPLKTPASHHTASPSAARCGYPSTLVRRFQNRLSTFLFLQTIFSMTWSGLTATPVKFSALNTVARKAVKISALSKSCTRPAPVCVRQNKRHFGVPSKLVSQFSALSRVVEVRKPILTSRELDSQRMFTANHDVVRLLSLRQPPRAFVDRALAPRNPHQVARAALPPVLVDNRPPICFDVFLPAFHDAISHQQVTDSQLLRVAPSPFSKIADSQLLFVPFTPPL